MQKSTLIFLICITLTSATSAAKDGSKTRKPSASDAAHDCSASIIETVDFGIPARRAECLVSQLILENLRPDLTAAVEKLKKDGYTRPFGEIKSIELKSDTSGMNGDKLQYRFLVVKTYSKEGAPKAFGIQNSILFYIDVIAPNNYADRAQVDIQKILANP